MTTDDAALKRILETSHSVASVGVSGSADKPSHWIFFYLKRQGYEMFPVNPRIEELFGLRAFPDLGAIKKRVDIVQLFRRAEDIPRFVDGAIEIGARVIWMQKGILNHEAARKAEAAGLEVVMDRCMMETHERLLGGIFSFDP